MVGNAAGQSNYDSDTSQHKVDSAEIIDTSATEALLRRPQYQ